MKMCFSNFGILPIYKKTSAAACEWRRLAADDGREEHTLSATSGLKRFQFGVLSVLGGLAGEKLRSEKDTAEHANIAEINESEQLRDNQIQGLRAA
jgi:hypothetical protein